MRICDQFDRYRDNELDTAERREFESHLYACEDCRAKKSLLDRVVSFIRSEEVRPLDIADQIAQRAFHSTDSWASAVISWLHPAPALAALALMVILFSSIWMISGGQKVSAYSAYETLLEEADAGKSESRFLQSRGESELVLWLEEGGSSQ